MKNCRKFKKLLQYTAFFDIMIMYGISIGLLFICHINLTFYVIYKRRIIRFYFCIWCFGTEKNTASAAVECGSLSRLMEINYEKTKKAIALPDSSSSWYGCNVTIIGVSSRR